MSVPVRRALYGKMAGHSHLTSLLAPSAVPGISAKAIYHQVAPSGAGFPYVIFFKAAGTPHYSMGRLAYDNEIWTIKGVAEGQNAADLADNIAFQLDELLTSQRTDSTSNTFISGVVSIAGADSATRPYLRREADVEYSEVVDGVLYAHSGANYRLIYQPD